MAAECLVPDRPSSVVELSSSKSRREVAKKRARGQETIAPAGIRGDDDGGSDETLKADDASTGRLEREGGKA